MGIQNITES